MKTLKDYFDNDTLTWFRNQGFEYKLADIKSDIGELSILYNGKFCIKLYDRMGHGFGVTTNLADNYDESLYDNDKFNLTWAFEYFKINQSATFNTRKVGEYEQNLDRVISDIRNIVPRLTVLTSIEWTTMVDWIDIEAKRRLG